MTPSLLCTQLRSRARAVFPGVVLVCTLAHAQARPTPPGQHPPASEWPAGWKLYEPYAEELSFVTPRVTTMVAKGVRTLAFDITDEQRFKGNIISPRVLLDNPYLDAADPFFNIPRQIACLKDGSVVVASTAKLHKEGRFKGNPYASGFWRIASDGAITALTAKHLIMEGSAYYPPCGLPFEKTSLNADVRPMTVAPDGSLLFGYGSEVRRLHPDGRLEPVPNRREACAREPPKPPPGLTFKAPEAAVEDPRGNVWVSDGCQLHRLGPDGSATEVLGKAKLCPAGEPQDYVRGEFLAWDSVHDELVMSGTQLWQKAPKSNVYSMIHRVKPDGTVRRVFLGVKLGNKAPRVDGISGLALDEKGRIYVGGGITAGSGYQVLRIEEPQGKPTVVAGVPRPTDVTHGDGPARQAYFGTFRSMCFSPDGTLYLNDANHVIRKLTTKGQVTTWAF